MDYSHLKYGLPLLAWIPALPMIGALINLTLGRRLSRSTIHVIAVASVAASCALSAYMVFGPLREAYKANPAQGGIGITQSVYTWLEVGGFKAELAFRLDTLSAVMIMIVTFIGTLIHIYSTGYMAHDPRPAAYFGYLNLFTGAMLVLVLAANMPVMFIGWEGVGLCSFLLIGFWYEKEEYANAGRKAFVVNRIGDFCFLLGMFLLFWAVKSLDFQDLKNPATAGTAYLKSWGPERLSTFAAILLFIGACGKSAQLPLFTWLPDAMAGPTPVSALIHAATMVTAGVYMICRLSFLFSTSTAALAVVATVGLLTALAAAFMAFAQTDLKKVLAYSTVSQLGFMFVAAGTGNWTAAIFHLGTHALFKACLFLGAGSVMHGMEHGGSTTPGDITKMGGLRKHMPLTRITFLVSCLAIAGIFPFAGFFSKDEILGGAWSVDPPGWAPGYGKILWAGLLLGALGTAFYMWRLYFLVFSGEERSEEAKKAHESPISMTGPLLVLAFLATIAGFIGLPHLRSPHFPAVTHQLSSWLEVSTTQTWYDTQVKIRPNLANAETCCCVDGTNNPEGTTELSSLTEPQLKQLKTANKRTEGVMTAETCRALNPPGASPAKLQFACAVDDTKRCAVEKVPDSTIWILMAIALGVGGLGIGLAWMFYGRGPTPTLERLVAGPLAPAYEASKAKLWFDEIYDVIIVRPYRAIARGLLEIVDRFIIDTVAVNGSAFVVGLFSRVSRWFQNGQVQRYLTGLVLGAALVFMISDCKSKATFEFEREGEMIILRARPGAGVIGSTAQLSWDITGDGEPDSDPSNPTKKLTGPEVRLRAGDLHSSNVTLIIEDAVTRKTIRVTRTLVEDSPEQIQETEGSAK